MQELTKNREDLLTQPVSKLLKKYSYPHFFSMLLMAVNKIIDSIFVGHGIDILALAALGILLPFTFLTTMAHKSLTAGMASILSRALGAQDTPKLQATLYAGLFLSLLLGGLLTLLYGLNLNPILVFLGATPQLLPYAYDYFLVFTAGLPIVFLFHYTESLLMSFGYSRPVFDVTLIGISSNIVLNYVFLFHLGWGMWGVSLATLLATILAWGYLLRVLIRSGMVAQFLWSRFKFKLKVVLEILHLSFPILISHLGMAVVVIYFNRFLSHHGQTVDLAIFSIVKRLGVFAMAPLLAISMGLRPILGFNWGAQSLKRCSQATRLALKGGILLSALISVLIIIFPQYLLKLFTLDPKILETGPFLLRVYYGGLIFISVYRIGHVFFHSLGQAKKSTIITLIHYLVFVFPLMLILPHYFGSLGVFLHFPVVAVLAALLISVFMLRQFRFIKSKI